MKYFFCKFVPPGREFLEIITNEQKRLMKAHSDFLHYLQEQSLIVAQGSVADPSGGWGMSLFETEDGQTIEDVRDALAEDPLVKADVGARYDVLPMLQLHIRS